MSYTILELAEAVAEAFGVRPHVAHLPGRNEVEHAFSDHTKARRVFGPREPIDLRTGIARMASWAKKHGARESSDMTSHIELPLNVPPSWL